MTDESTGNPEIIRDFLLLLALVLALVLVLDRSPRDACPI